MEPISKEWQEFKDEFSSNIEKVKESKRIEEETLNLMLNMLKNSRIKVRSSE
jgi:hypothetical protein